MYNNKMVLQSLIHQWIDLAEVSYKPGQYTQKHEKHYYSNCVASMFLSFQDRDFVLRHFQNVLRDGFFYDLIIFYHGN